MALPFYTIGHSNRSLGDFIRLLAGPHVGNLADIRSFPMTRANPQFNGEGLAAALAPRQIGYEHIAALGGLRKRVKDVPPEVNGLWQSRSFHNYADYALTPPFHAGFAHLRAEGERRVTAVMCAEAVWWRCHRRIVADWLLARGETVFHIMEGGRLVPAILTPGAVVGPGGAVTYPVPS
ncbi:MAG TPA: DUF488 domain-containing protein [Albidovulum sp.]|uniref:DUF488 domain-containing protein n=1 Tax=Albidovulum sp. TaxID=1872424 RepID=UPI002BF6F0AB|nr:DUF488 domain-containing protein [Albidovulum sp.]